MATISRLIVAIGADTSALRQGLGRATADLQRFSRTVAGVSNVSSIFGNLANTGAAHQAGVTSAQTMIDAAKATFATKEGERIAAFAGVYGKPTTLAQFRRAGRLN